MNEGWIKLYRKSKDNPLMRDYTAWAIFCWMLLTVDRINGKMTLGRKWASEYFSMNESTFYKAIKRLEKKYKVVSLVTRKVTTKFTEVSVLNWHKYQEKNGVVTQGGNNEVTMKYQSSNNPVTHIQEVENKELRIEKGITPPFKKISFLINLPIEVIQELSEKYICNERQIRAKAEQLYDYCHAKGRVYKDYKAFLRNALSKDFGERIITPKVEPDDLPELSEEQRLKNVAMIKNKMKEIFKDRIIN